MDVHVQKLAISIKSCENKMFWTLSGNTFCIPAQNDDELFVYCFNIPIHNKLQTGTNERVGIFKGGGLLLFIEKE